MGTTRASKSTHRVTRRLAAEFDEFPDLAHLEKVALNVYRWLRDPAPRPPGEMEFQRFRLLLNSLLPAVAAVDCSPLLRLAVEIERELSRKTGRVLWQDAFDRAKDRGCSHAKAAAIADLVNSHEPGRPERCPEPPLSDRFGRLNLDALSAWHDAREAAMRKRRARSAHQL